MKLVYSEMSQDLTAILTQEAQEFAKKDQRVFYIAPNSLSFEMERKVLERLEGQASFDIMVTRFGQMARYFVLNESPQGETLDDIGMTMLFYRVLSQFDDTELKVYGKLKQDMGFISQLLALYKEMQSANLSVSDLEAMDSPEKREDLSKIFSVFAEALGKETYAHESKLAFFTRLVSSGNLDAELSQVALVIDGFTRFSAEEEALVAALSSRVSEIVIGIYASQKAYNSTYIEGNIYQAPVDFLRQLAQAYQVKPAFLSAENELDSLGKISKNLENQSSFSDEKLPLTDQDLSVLQIWDVTNQKEEVEQVARAIRHDLQEGYRYKDILVLLGDVDAYQLQIGKIFDKYEIPFYLGKAEEMSHHPLVHFVESLERVKRYNFRTEDVLNLLKSGLYGHFQQFTLDKFEQYLLFADVKGQAKFARDFTVNTHGKYDLDFLNRIRHTFMAPLQELFKAQAQSGRSILQKFSKFLQQVQLAENMQSLAADRDELALEKEEQVWKAFCHILGLTNTIFGQEKLRLDEFLALLRAGMEVSCYRVVPATVDVVNVKSYDLIAPHTAKKIYAIGLSKSNFPKITKNTSLLTEEEKLRINDKTDGVGHFDIPSRENTKKNHFTMLSLVNSATDQLVLSSPQIFNEAEDRQSPYLKLLADMGVERIEKGREKTLSAQDIGHYKGLLSRVIEANRADFNQEWTQEEATFWAVAVRYLRKKLEVENIAIPAVSSDLKTVQLAEETLDKLYPSGQPLQLSASSLTTFYQNEYLYFLRYVLRLEEQDSIHPDARSHGNFLHRIFERVMTDDNPDFDQKLGQAITATRQEAEFTALYQNDAESQFSEQRLLDIARATSLVLRDDSIIDVLEDEAVFGAEDSNLLTLGNGRAVNIRGKIDRLDSIKSDGALGVVDYKSSKKEFKLADFYNGLSPQLMTYIAAIKNHKDYSHAEKIFGAMYLHMLDPIVNLKDTKGADTVLAEAYKSLVYRGLFMEEETNRLNQFYYKAKNTTFNADEMALLLAHNERLYKEAAEKILSGSFSINPYTQDGKSVAGEQVKAITGFEANLHLAYARHLETGGKREDWIERMRAKGGQS
ncbi:ATP-dependent nuclease subunit B [Streptococcus gallolyticus]|uniref:ATP-dependent nuclease subunit B n=1 Tax=Streptococcus hepaticus TaxID=3349163 RepID=UPI001C96A8A0|nr:ATP-dependent nuclease subunit B [Streptococcus gallolyticus]MBY5042091.1 ATP-dependent nuclease subunit B [Streptococcus gallolyticus]